MARPDDESGRFETSGIGRSIIVPSITSFGPDASIVYEGLTLPKYHRPIPAGGQTLLNELLIEKWDSVRSGLLDAIDKFTDEELSFKPAASAYSAIETMLHIAHEEQIEVHRKPRGRAYQERQVYQGDAEIHPLALPTATLQPSRLFGG